MKDIIRALEDSIIYMLEEKRINIFDFIFQIYSFVQNLQASGRHSNA